MTESMLWGADLTDANLAGATLGNTIFIECSTLHLCCGLADIIHAKPSVLDVKTLRASCKYLSDDFLAKVGFTDQEIVGLRSVYGRCDDTVG